MGVRNSCLYQIYKEKAEKTTNEEKSDIKNSDNPLMVDKEDSISHLDAKTDCCFSSDDSIQTSKQSHRGVSSHVSSRSSQSPHLFWDQKSLIDRTPSPLDSKPPQKNHINGVPTLTLSQYKRITGLSTVVSSNFGVVIPDAQTSVQKTYSR